METTLLFKEVKQRKSVACEACRKRKQKCEGHVPCAYCVSKHIECQIGDQQKRGRKKLEMSDDGEGEQSTVLVKESQLLGNVEMRNHIRFFTSLEQLSPLFDYEQLIAPSSAALEVQAYTISALSAQFRGQYGSSIIYATKARTLVGAVFDVFDIDAAVAIVLMSHYWKKTLNLALCSHYAEVAWNLMRSLKNPPIHRHIFCFHEFIIASEAYTAEHKAHLIESFIHKLSQQISRDDLVLRCLLSWLYILSKLFRWFGNDLNFPRDTSTIFLSLDNIHVSEEQYNEVLPAFRAVQSALVLSGERSGTHEMHALYGRAQHVLVAWKSGHIEDAMTQAQLCLEMALIIWQNNVLDLISDFGHMCMLGCIIQFFQSQGETESAVKMCQYIKFLCTKMGPDYKPIVAIVDTYITEISPSSSTTTTTSTSTTTTTSTSTSTHQSAAPTRKTLANKRKSAPRQSESPDSSSLDLAPLALSPTRDSPPRAISPNPQGSPHASPPHSSPYASPQHGSPHASPHHGSPQDTPHSSPHTSPPHGTQPSPPHGTQPSPPHGTQPSPPHAYTQQPPQNYAQAPPHNYAQPLLLQAYDQPAPPRVFAQPSPPHTFAQSPPHGYTQAPQGLAHPSPSHGVARVPPPHGYAYPQHGPTPMSSSHQRAPVTTTPPTPPMAGTLFPTPPATPAAPYSYWED